jgi:hypothetical protein
MKNQNKLLLKSFTYYVICLGSLITNIYIVIRYMIAMIYSLISSNPITFSIFDLKNLVIIITLMFIAFFSYKKFANYYDKYDKGDTVV